MNEITKIKTIETFNEFKLKEKSSIFIGQVYHVESEEECITILNGIKKKYYDATHHCYAYRLNDKFVKYSDDGEPNGSAGIRILNAIEHFDLISVILVIIRYFGGTKLGVGPLGKTYYNTAHKTLETAHIIAKSPYYHLTIIAEFSDIGYVHRILSSSDSKIIDTIYNEKVVFNCLISPSVIDNINNQLREISKGHVKLEIDDDIIYTK